LRSPKPQRNPLGRCARLVFLASAAAALIDLNWNLAVSRPHQFHPDLFLRPVFFLLLSALLFTGVAWWIGYRFVDQRTLAAEGSAAAHWVFFTPIWALLFNLLGGRLPPRTLEDGIQLAIITAAAAAVTLGLKRVVYPKRSDPIPEAPLNRIENFLLLLNAFLIVLLTFILAELVWIEGLLSAESLLALSLLIVASLTLLRIRAWSHVVFRWVTYALVMFFVAALAIIGADAFEQPRLEHPGTARHAGLPPVILITIDTLRADSLASYGGEGGLTPSLDALAEKSILFERAFASSPWTLPSMASIMTGVSALVHQTPDRSAGLPMALPTLAEELREGGYVTLGVGRNAYLRAPVGFSRGFDFYRFYPRTTYLADSLGTQLLRAALPNTFDNDATTTDLAQEAAALVKEFSEQLFFLWAHFFDPHVPYAPPEQFLAQDPSLGEFGTRFDKVTEVRSGQLFPDSKQRHWIRTLYEGEIRYVDHEIGRFLSTLERLDLFDPSLIVVTSDHGEEFWEHGGFEHGHALNNEVIGVPLIIKPPRSPGTSSFEGLRVESPVSIASVRSTILGVVGVPSKDPAFPLAKSLIPYWAETQLEGASDPIVSGALKYFGQQLSVVRGPYKYIRHLEDGREELFDLVSDPSESNNLASTEPDLRRELAEVLDQEVEKSQQIADKLVIGQNATEIHMDKETERELRSLGYIE